jgi:tRNA(adenine34) deaminase
MSYFGFDDGNDQHYMRLALQQAEIAGKMGEVPVGAVITKGNDVIASSHNMREHWQDATAHAELIAVRQACGQLKTWRLSGCTIYVTLEPCPMCAGAIVAGRLERLVYGCPDSRFGGAETIFNIVNNPSLNHRLQVRAGVCEKECRELMQEFFKNKRL